MDTASQPRFEERAAFAVMGVQARFDKDDKTFFDETWMKGFMPYDEQVKPLSPDKAYYGVWFYSGDQEHPNYLAGMAVDPARAGEAPGGLVLRELPAARYAVFDTAVGQIGDTYDYVYAQWLPASPYEYDIMCTDFEYYPPDTADRTSPVQVYVPVRAKAQA